MSRLARGWVVTTIVTVAASRALAVSGAADVYVARAIVAYEDKRYDDALRELDEALELEPENVEAHFYSGLVRIALGELGDAAAALERARSLSPEDPAILYQLGVVNVRRKRDDLARPLLEDAFRLKPSLDGLGYHLGVVRYRAGEYQAALEAFEASVSADRDIEQLTRFYAGLASLRLGLAERATHEVEEALRLRPASPLTGPAERLRELALAARGREGRPVERRVRLELRVGGFYDDNVSVQPETSDDPVARSLRQGDRDSPGAITALRAAGLLLRRGALEATGSYSFFSTSNVDLPEFDIIDNLLELAAAHRGAVGRLPYELTLRYGFEYVTLGLDEFVQRHAVSPVATLVESERHLTALQLQLRADDFADDDLVGEDDQRDGLNWLAGFFHLVRFAEDRHLLKAGYQWDLEDTDGRNFRYLGHRVLAGAQTTLPRGEVRLGYDFDLHVRDYRNVNTTFPTAAPGTRERSDTEYNHTIWVARPLPRGFGVFAAGQLTDAQSNLDVFDFRRNVVTVGFTWSY